MGLSCIQSPPVTAVHRTNGSLFSSRKTVVKCSVNSSIFKFPSSVRYFDSRIGTKGVAIPKPQANYIVASSGVNPKDENLVFVAGATGKVGSRTVRELLKLGFKVRAGVRSVQRAASLVQSVKNMKMESEAETQYNLELVECDLERPDRILPALGNSSTIICCIGASEKEILDITGPYRIDYKATENLIAAATSAKVKHLILVTSLGTNKVGFPAAILNLFWGVLLWKRKAEEALLASGIPYTIVRPGGMERPTDSFKETHNITLSKEDTLFGGLVSNLQVAELIAFMAKNRSLSYCKVVEVVAETTAPLTPFEDLLKKIPSKREKDPSSMWEETAPVSDRNSESKDPEKVKASTSKALSPYACYEDLKPPTSPTPTASRAVVVSFKKSNTSTELKRPQSSSPYSRYEDLKPPSSPSPTASKSSETTPAPSSKVNAFVKSNSSPEEPKRTCSSSPYSRYHDLRPPSSPSPSVPA